MGKTVRTPEDAAVLYDDAPVPLSAAVFAERWRLITGELPAILLSSQIAMLALLVECTPVAPFEGPIPAWDARPADRCKAR